MIYLTLTAFRHTINLPELRASAFLLLSLIAYPIKNIKKLSKNDKIILYSNKLCVILQSMIWILHKVMEDGSMWNGEKSITLSKFCVLAFSAMLAGTVLTAPWLIQRLMDFSRADLTGKEGLFMSTIYLGSIPAAVLLLCLYRLLRRIELEQVFIIANVEYLRRISWSCFAGAAISMASSAYYFPWIFVAVAAAFMGLIVRVVKNIVAQAVELKNESELTI